MEGPLLSIRDLSVTFSTPDGPVAAASKIDLEIHPGETLGIVGESGSGKSQIMNAVMGLLASNGHAGGAVHFQGQSILDLPDRAMNRIRGAAIGMIFQEPMSSLDPLYTIGQQMVLPIRRHSGLSSAQARARARELLELVRMPEPDERLRAYPHQLSGGQRQRVMIAMAIAHRPKLLIADEPTTALDVTVQVQILDLIDDLKRRFGMAVALISHDLNLVRRHADRVAVMRAGQIVEQGTTRQVFAAPATDYTRMLLAAEPQGVKALPEAEAPVVLEGEKISVAFARPRRLFRPAPAPFHAVRDVSIHLRQGETLGIVGESGSGKSTLGRALLRLVPATGSVRFDGGDLARLDADALKGLRRNMQIVFQDPFGSLSPRMTVGDIVAEGLLVHEPGLGRPARAARADEALAAVGVDPAARNRVAHEFSGGQRQRIAIARALVLRPRLILLDEPTSALDRTVQKTILTLLRDLQLAHGLSYLFISHDLKVVRAMADRIIVMKDGAIVEQGVAAEVLEHPREAYTRALMQAAYLTGAG